MGANLERPGASVGAEGTSQKCWSEWQRCDCYPTYVEWNLEFQQALGTKDSFSLNYVGNHGYDLAAEKPV